MRIAYLMSADPYNSFMGTEIGAMISAEALARRGHEVTIFHGYATGPTPTDSIVRTVAVRHSELRYVAGLDANRKIRNLVRRGYQDQFDVIDLFGASLGSAFYRLRESSSRYVYHAIDLALLEWSSLERRKVLSLPFYLGLAYGEMRALQRADTVIALTNGVKADILSSYHSHVEALRVVPLPLKDEWLETPRDQERQHFLYIAAGQRRRTDIFLRALAQLRDGGLMARGIVLRETRTEFRNLARRLGVEVTFHDGIRHSAKGLIDCYSMAFALILPSRREGMCLPVIEAASQLTPTISTPLPAVMDFIEDGRNGLIVDSEDPAQWAEKMHTLATDPHTQHTLGMNARSKAETYRASEIARRLESVYQEPRELSLGSQQ